MLLDVFEPFAWHGIEFRFAGFEDGSAWWISDRLGLLLSAKDDPEFYEGKVFWTDISIGGPLAYGFSASTVNEVLTHTVKSHVTLPWSGSQWRELRKHLKRCGRSNHDIKRV